MEEYRLAVIAISFVLVVSCIYIPFGLTNLVRVRRDLPLTPRFWLAVSFITLGGVLGILDTVQLWFHIPEVVLVHRLLFTVVAGLFAMWVCKVLPHDRTTPSPVRHSEIQRELDSLRAKLTIAKAQIARLRAKRE